MKSLKRKIIFWRKASLLAKEREKPFRGVTKGLFFVTAAVCLLLAGCAGIQGQKTADGGEAANREETTDREGVSNRGEAAGREEVANPEEITDREGVSNREEAAEREEVEAPGTAAEWKETEIALEKMGLLQWEDAEQENLADLLQRQGGGMMVQIGAGSRLGSGVIYDTEQGGIRILTAAHVLEEAEDGLRVTFSDGLSVICSDYVTYDVADLGLLWVDAAQIPQENLEAYLRANVDKESFDAVRPEDGCIVMGSKSGVAAEAYEGTVLDGWIYLEDYGQYMMWVKAESRAGMSGGGLFDRRGHFLGILSGRTEDGEMAAVPLSLILAALESE
ncbi:MAG: serine protease [bacterium]|nr:serine protease [bacterium]